MQAAPSAAVPLYDAAAVLYRLGRYEQARDRYMEARLLADDALRTKIDYALGNTALGLGDVPAAIAAYDSCIASTARGAELDVVRRDAAINREFAHKHAQSPAIPQGQGPDDPSVARPDGRRLPDRNPGGEDPSAEGDDESDPSAGGDNSGNDADRNGRDRRRRHRRTGGAGGSRKTPPGASGRVARGPARRRAGQHPRRPVPPPPRRAAARIRRQRRPRLVRSQCARDPIPQRRFPRPGK